jgi:sugar lactone lactonase YvrE
MAKVNKLFSVKNDIGEGPLWHPIENCLYWIDITKGKIFKSDTSLSAFETFQFDMQIGAIGFRKDGGLILATDQGFAFWKEGQSEPDFFWNPLPGREGVRLNDGKVDPAGRFWAGSMDTEKREGELYRVDPDGSQHVILEHIGISNGLGWSPDRKTMYYTDSLQFAIFAFDYDLETGQISNKHRFIEIPEDDRWIPPDGLCVDADGCIWGALWNGYEVVRYDLQGKPILKLEIPAQQVTSCGFAGENLDQLVITSASYQLSNKMLKQQPDAGNVFIYQTDTQGQIVHLFG